MRKFFMTATADTPLADLLADNLRPGDEAETIITSGGVWQGRNQRIFNPGYIVRKGATVRVYVSAFQGRYYQVKKEHLAYEDEDLLAVYKPCDLNVHAVPSSIYYNLAYGVGRYLAGQGPAIEPTPPTRLDRPVAGLVLFAKHKKAERGLFRLVREGKIKKWYMAALEKGSEEALVRVRDTIENDGGLTVSHPGGKAADTLFARRETLENADIYSAFPFTGRRHQIRFHAAHYLRPILGDRSYGSRYSLKPDEIALVCRGYNFTWKEKRLRIRLPEPFLQEFYERIARAHPLTPALSQIITNLKKKENFI